MDVLLLSDDMAARHADRLLATAAAVGAPLTLLPASAASASAGAGAGAGAASTAAPLTPSFPSLAHVTCAWYSRDLFAAAAPSPHTSPSDGPIDAAAFFALVDRARALTWLHVMSAATDIPHYRASIARGVRLSTASGIAAVPIAHTVTAAVLAQARGFPHWLATQQQRRWAPIPGHLAPADLAGQHAVIVGLGPIGREIARLLTALGMRTTGVRQQAAPDDAVQATLTYDQLDQALHDCHWLILCCPLTPRTHRLIDRDRLYRLPRGARLVNVGRGGVLDEDALVEALGSGHLAGGYLDVFDTEPLPPASPLWSLPGLWLSPHNSATSSGNGARDLALFEDNLARFLRGRPLLNEAGAARA